MYEAFFREGLRSGRTRHEPLLNHLARSSTFRVLLSVDPDNSKRLGAPQACRSANDARPGAPTFGQCSRVRCLTDMGQPSRNLTLKAVGYVHIEAGSLTRK